MELTQTLGVETMLILDNDWPGSRSAIFDEHVVLIVRFDGFLGLENPKPILRHPGQSLHPVILSLPHVCQPLSLLSQLVRLSVLGGILFSWCYILKSFQRSGL